MANYFSGTESDQHFSACVSAGVTHVLTSFLYLKKRNDFEIVKKRKKANPHMKWMVDSGAHSFITDINEYGKWSIKDWENYLDEYTAWLRDNRDYIECAVELDIDYVVGASMVEKWQKQYFLPLVEEGIDICFVWHDERGMEGWEEMCSKFSYVGLPGELSKKPDFTKYMAVAKRYTTRIHGFAASVTGDSKVVLRNEDTGEVECITIEEAFNRATPDTVTEIDEWRKVSKQSVWTLSDSLTPIFSPVTRVVKHILDKKIYRITLRGGKQLSCTGDHSIFSLDSTGQLIEVKPEHLVQGDLVVSSLGLPSFEGVDVPCNDAEFYGYWFGDGYVDKQLYHVGCSKQHQPEIRNLCEQFAKRHNANITPIVSGTVDAYISSAKVSRQIVNLFGRVGSDKHLGSVFNWSDSSRAAFLRGYYSADGSAKGKNANISLSCFRRDILEGIQLLLEYWDIRSAITGPSFSGKGGECWKIDISDGVSRKNFAEHIGFIQPDQMNQLLCKPSGGNIGRYRGLPVELLKTTGRYNSASCQNRPVAHIKRASLGHGNFVSLLENMVAQCSEIVCIEVVSEGGIPVYDLEVPGVERFFANGVLAHNTKQSDFRDHPWYSIDSITWKHGEISGVLTDWDERTQKLKHYNDKTKRVYLRSKFQENGFDADAIIDDTNYKEVTRYCLWSMSEMEKFYVRRFKDRIFYYELRLPHPKVVPTMGGKAVRRYWKKYRPEQLFQKHSEETSYKKIRTYLHALSCVQYSEIGRITADGREFLKTYFSKMMESSVIDPISFQKEVAIYTSPPNPVALRRTELEHFIPQNNPPRQRDHSALWDDIDEVERVQEEVLQLFLADEQLTLQ